MVLTIAVCATQLTPNQKTYATFLKKAAAKVTAQGNATLEFSDDKLRFSVSIKTSGLDGDTPIAAHVHDAECLGTVLFSLSGKLNGSGEVEFEEEFAKDKAGKNIPTTIPTNWFFNFHDTKVIDPQTGKGVSLGCEKLSVSDNGAKASAKVKNHTVTFP